jgi:hypothetical protein
MRFYRGEAGRQANIEIFLKGKSMRHQRVVRSINYPKATYKKLQAEQKKLKITNRDQVRLAVEGHIDHIRKLLVEAGFSKREDEPQLVRLSVDLHIDNLINKTADELGLDYSAILLACLRSKYGLRIGDPGAEKLKREIARRENS